MRKTVLSGAVALSLLSLNVNALSVGEIDVKSFLGQPLDVSIDLRSATKSELSTLEVNLAPRAAFEQAQITYPDNAEDLLIELDSSNTASPKIRVKSTNSISEPFVHLLLKISWAGGNILREYTALIDPPEYKQKPMAKAASADTKLGVSKPADNADDKVHGLVKSGDSLSAIAALYRPADVSIHQAWMAFYKLNPKAFPDNNLNRIQKGSQILIPTHAQMTAISQSKAVQEVKKLTKPLGGGDLASAKPAAEKKKPKLVVGGGKDEEPAQTANSSKKKSAESDEAVTATGNDQLASIKAEFSTFKEDVTRKLEESQAQTAQAKEQLVAARGQNRLLNEQIVELEKQLSNVNSLLELQKNAVQALTEELAEGGQVSQGISANDANNPAIESDDEKAAAMSQGTQSMPSNSGANTEASADEGAIAGTSSEQNVSTDTVTEANKQEQAEIAKSQELIAKLEKELQEKNKLEAQLNAQAQEAAEKLEAAEKTASEQPEQPQAVAEVINTTNTAVSTPQVQTEQGFADKATGVFGSIRSILAGISSDIWKIIGVIAAALLGLFLYSNKRQARDEEFEDEDSFAFSELDEIDDGITHDVTKHLVGEEDSLPTMQSNQTGEDNDNDGSALFDLSDESFMASEAVENDSSLFAMDEEFGSFGKMASSGGTAGSALQSSIPQMGDVDPVTEAEVYLAYDRKEQAFNVLEQALQENPNQGKVVSKLLTLYRDNNDVDSFTRVFESSIENVDDDDQWGDIKQIAQEFIPTHKLVDDFDSSIPVLLDELAEEDAPKKALSDSPKTTDSEAQIESIELEAAAEDDDDILAAAIQELEGDKSHAEGQSDVLTIDDEELDLDEASMMFVEDDQVINEEKGESTPDFALENEREQSDVLEEALDAGAADSEQDSEVDVQEINEHDPETALALAKAYIELGENDIAKDFLKDVIDAGSEKLKGEAEALLASVS